MALKRPRRGISVGTIVMLSLCVATLLVGAVVFARISGDIGDIVLDPKLLTEPLTAIVGSLTDGQPQPGENQPVNSVQQGDAQQGDTPPSEQSAAITPAPTATPEPTPLPSRTLTITAVGQIVAGSELHQAASGSGGNGFDSVFSGVGSSLAGSDAAIATLRTGLTEDSAALGAYNAPSALALAMQSAGFNIVNLGTDRALDQGVAGLQTTLDILQRTQMTTVGAFRSASERQAKIIDAQGVKIGLLSYTGPLSNAGASAASSEEAAASLRSLQKETAVADIRALRQQADIVIVLAHWGSRSDAKTTQEMQDLADAFANAGADIILGTHPTTVLPFDRRTVAGEDGTTREVFIAYSLGNFLTDESRDTTDITGVVLQLTIQWDGQTQRASIIDSTYMPTWVMRWRDADGVNRYQVTAAGSAAKPANMTDTIYSNMKKAYDSMVNRLGKTHASPKTEP